MANRVYISLKEVREVGFDFKPIGESNISVYINCDGVSAWLGCANNEEELMALVSPENIRETMEENLSKDELEIIDGALFWGGNYTVGNKEFKIMKTDSFCFVDDDDE